MSLPWTPVFPLDTLPVGAARVHKAGRVQVAVFRLEDGGVAAVDNRCPHEGYPLQQGHLRGTTLTCAWHNFKFNVCTGSCLMGDETLATWPVRVVDGMVELDLSPPDRSAELPGRWASLADAMSERRQGQMARDVTRLLDLGVAPVAIAAWGAAWDADRGEYGPSHAMAVLTDALATLADHPGLSAAHPLSQALDLASEAQVRRPPRARPPALPLPDAPAAALRDAVEREDAAAAEGIVRGGLAAGVPWREVLGWIDGPLADHFLDFGHALIYQEKLVELLAATDGAHADALLGGHVFGIVNGTREDTLPPWSGFRRRLAEVDLAELAARPRPGTLDRHALTDGAPGDLLERVLHSDAPLDAILAALVEAAAERLYRFDASINLRSDVQNDWLDVTHRLTFVDAVRAASRRIAGPDLWRMVLQATWFVAKAAPLDGPRLVYTRASGSLDDLAAALRERRAADAVGIAAAGYDADREGLRRALVGLYTADVAVRPIVVGHVLKSTVAAFRCAEATGSALPVLAVVRWLASPVRERQLGRRVEEAIRLVTEGKPPVRLAD